MQDFDASLQSISGGNDERTINKNLGACDCYRAKQSDFSPKILAMPMPMVGCEELKTLFTILHCCFFQVQDTICEDDMLPHENEISVDVYGSVHVGEDVGDEESFCGANPEHRSHVLPILKHPRSH